MGINLKAYDCTQYGDNVLTQGSVVKVCIEPVPGAITDGFRMRHVSFFKFVRPETNYTQWAVQDQVGVEPFSSLTCNRGSTQCVIEVFLLAGFYTSPGTIDASGSATMQLGEATGRSRLLVDEMRQRRNYNNNNIDEKENSVGEHYTRAASSSSSSSSSALRGPPPVSTRSLQDAAAPNDGAGDEEEEGVVSSIEQEILIKLRVTDDGASLGAGGGGGITYGPDGQIEIDPDDVEDFVMDAPLIKKWEYLLNNDAALKEAESYMINNNDNKEAVTPSYIASIVILVLIGLNFLALIMLAFQNRRCQHSRLYLG